MPGSPYDEFLTNLARMVEDMIREMPDADGVRFVGCTIIAGNPGDVRQVIHVGKNPADEIEYEVVEDEGHIFVTGKLPPESPGAAYADIAPEEVTIVVGEKRASIPLGEKIDVIHSFYQVRHGVIDIILKKKKKVTP